jgi:hypothetical protein
MNRTDPTWTDTQREMRKLQNHLRQALAVRKRLNFDLGLEEDEMHTEISTMIETIDFEISVFDSLLNDDDDDELDTDEGGKDAWRGKDA